MARLSRELEQQRIYAMYEQQRQAGPAAFVIGVDEVGRGSVAGPLSVAAVCLPAEPMIEGLNDSKKLTPARRESLSREIKACALGLAIAHVEAADIDAVGMAMSLRQAMSAAIAECEAQLGRVADHVLIDGNPMRIHKNECCIVKGDSLVACIAAASIVAKVCRDELMVAAAELYPSYGLDANKGYASAAHIAAIKRLGLSPMHRRSFCGNFLQESLF